MRCARALVVAVASAGVAVTVDSIVAPVTGALRATQAHVFDDHRCIIGADRALVKTIPVGGRPRNVAFDLPGRTALVTNEQAVVFVQ